MKRIIRTEPDGENETTCGMCGEDFIDDNDGVTLIFYDNDIFQYLCHRCAFEVDPDCGWLPDDDEELPRFSHPTSTEMVEFPKDQIWVEALKIKPKPIEWGTEGNWCHPRAVAFILVHEQRVTAEIQWIFRDGEVPGWGPSREVAEGAVLPIHKLDAGGGYE